MARWGHVFREPESTDGVGVHRMPRATDQTAQVDSLYVYASAVTALIIIAPDSVHEQTKEEAGLESYKSRVCWLGFGGWGQSRAE